MEWKHYFQQSIWVWDTKIEKKRNAHSAKYFGDYALIGDCSI